MLTNKIAKWNESKYFNLSNNLYAANLRAFISLTADTIRRANVLSILDLGCGNGCALQEILRINNKRRVFCCGLDIDSNVLINAATKGTRVVMADANLHLPFRNESFDLIISNQLLEYLVNTENFFKQIHRLLKRGGEATISVPNLAAWHNISCLLLGWYPVGLHIIDVQVGNLLKGMEAHGHIRLFTYKALKDLCAIYNFKLETIIGIGYYPFIGIIANLIAKVDVRHCVYFIFKVKKI